MPDSAPLVKTFEATAPAAIAADAQSVSVVEAPYAATVTSVSFTPAANITGAATNYRTYSLINKGSDGNGTTSVATLAFSSSGVTANDFDEKAITLSGTPANLAVVAGDILAWVETVAGTGLATPGGLVQVELTRS